MRPLLFPLAALAAPELRALCPGFFLAVHADAFGLDPPFPRSL